MPRTLYRFTAVPKKAGQYATDLTFDAILDDAGYVDDDRPIFGMQGTVEGIKPDRLPLVIDSRGEIDWGAAYDNPCLKDTRKCQSDIREIKLIDHAVITLRFEDGTIAIFEISKRVPLLVGNR